MIENQDLEEVICKEILLGELLKIEFHSILSLEEFLSSRGRRKEYIEEIFDRTSMKAKTFKRKEEIVNSLEQKLFRNIRNNRQAREIMKELAGYGI